MKNLILLATCLSLSLGAAVEKPFFGYGSSDAVIPAKDQEMFFSGFEVGFDGVSKRKLSTTGFVTEHVYNGSQLGAVEGAQRLLAKGVQVVLGFPTSHESVLVGKLLAGRPVFALFPAPSHSALATFGPFVYSTGESQETAVRALVHFIQKKFPGQKGMLVFNPYAVYSRDQKENFERMASTPAFAGVKMDFVPMDSELTLSAEALGKLKRGEYGYVYLTQYAGESKAILAQLRGSGIDMPLVANSSWLTGDIEFVRRFLALRKSPLYSSGVWLQGSKESLPFEAAIQKRYGIHPSPEMAYGYDMGVIVGTVYNDLAAEPVKTAELFRQHFIQRRCFDGTSAGRICFGPHGGHADRRIYFVRFTKSGFVAEEGK